MEGFDFSDFITDPVLEVEGVWRQFGIGSRIKLARWENTDYERLFRKKVMAEREVLQADDELSAETLKAITIDVMAHTIIRDWENFRVNGVLTPFSIGKAKELLKNKDFREKVKGMSNVIDHYKTKTEQEGVKP
jgi:hypothetical protein